MGSGSVERRGGAGRSQHPVDRLIRELIQTRRQATTHEIQDIRDHLSVVAFSQRILPVPTAERNTTYLGRTIGARAPSDFLHLVRYVVHIPQWASGATLQQYLDDLHAAVQDPQARLAIYERRGGAMAMVVTPTTVIPAQRLGRRPEQLVVVIYSADWSTIVSGYQASSLQALTLPGDAVWLL